MLNDFDTITITRAISDNSELAVCLCRKKGELQKAEYTCSPKDSFDFEVQAIKALFGVCDRRSVVAAINDYFGVL